MLVSGLGLNSPWLRQVEGRHGNGSNFEVLFGVPEANPLGTARHEPHSALADYVVSVRLRSESRAGYSVVECPALSISG